MVVRHRGRGDGAVARVACRRRSRRPIRPGCSDGCSGTCTANCVGTCIDGGCCQDDHCGNATCDCGETPATCPADCPCPTGYVRVPAGEFDIDLVRLIIRYMEEYPDRFHHPKEELLFDAAGDRDPEFRERATVIRSQHRAR